MNKLKDFLYDISDYLLGLIIIAVIAGLIFFRMGDSLTMDFNFMAKGDANESTISKVSEVEEDTNTPEVKVSDSDTISLSTEGEENVETGNTLKPVETVQEAPTQVQSVSQAKPETTTVTETVKTETSQVADTTVTIKVPQGSSAYGIGKILRSNGLIKNEKDFYNRSIEMKLDSKLQSGTFKLKTSMSLDDIIRKLAGQ
ncbi:MAG: endolytic transglycosylase MltG [Firmicutes bacterium]|jgi:hypothetical protein|nr:endolytic transglycosylase MltG [Bacillota bacterium]